MAEGDEQIARRREIRVRLDGNVTEGDIDALRMWLEREKPIEEGLRDGSLRIHERHRSDAPRDEQGTPMGLGMEIVVNVVAALAATSFNQLLGIVKEAVQAWIANRQQVHGGRRPDSSVDVDESHRE